MSRSPEVREMVDALVGLWTGHGEGGYPTIESFRYREVTRFSDHPDHPALHYEQRTWRITEDGEVVSHWETGLVRISSDGMVTLNNAQGGRSETMTGSWHRANNGWVIELAGTDFAGDARMIGTRRAFDLTESRLAYRMHMETSATNEMLLHLEATLRKDR